MIERTINERERDKANMANMAQGLAGISTDQCATGPGEPQRESLTGRLRNDLSRSRRDARRQGQLEELLYLLDKNPEVARILDLVDSVGNKY